MSARSEMLIFPMLGAFFAEAAKREQAAIVLLDLSISHARRRTGISSFRGNVLRSLGFMQQASDGQSVIHTFAPPQRRRRVRIDVNARGLMQG